MRTRFTPSFTAKTCAVCIGGPLIALSIGAPIAMASPSSGSGTGNTQSRRPRMTGPRPRRTARVPPHAVVRTTTRSRLQTSRCRSTGAPWSNPAARQLLRIRASTWRWQVRKQCLCRGGGLFNVAVADHNSTAKATGGILNFASADNDSTATAEDGTLPLRRPKMGAPQRFPAGSSISPTPTTAARPR